jgi:alpha-galactosidase
MSNHQRDLVAEAVRVYKTIRADLAAAVPFWPLGLPRWADSWFALGLRAPDASYLTVWRRGPLGPAGSGNPAEAVLPIPHLRGKPPTIRVLYPTGAAAGISWDAAAGTLTVPLPRTPSACVISLLPSLPIRNPY